MNHIISSSLDNNAEKYILCTSISEEKQNLSTHDTTLQEKGGENCLKIKN